MATATESATTYSPSLVRLFYGVFAGPIGWTVILLVNYILVPPACAIHNSLPLYLVWAVAVVAQALGAVLSWITWQSLRGIAVADVVRADGVGAGNAFERLRFLAWFGFFASSFFLLVSAASVIPIIVLSPCANHTIMGVPL